jgi:hypothetical protein
MKSIENTFGSGINLGHVGRESPAKVIAGGSLRLLVGAKASGKF